VLTTTRTFVISSESPSEPPLLAPIGDKVAVFGKLLEFTIRASDLDQDALTFAANGLPPGATLTPGVVYGTAIFSWSAAASDVGTHAISFTVTDSQGGTDQATINIVARATNSAPLLLPVGDRSVAENSTLHIQLAAMDADGDPLIWSASNLPPGAVLDSATGLLTWHTNYFSAGQYNGVLLTVSDGDSSSSETIRITVTPTNQAPLLAAIPPLGGQEQRLLQFSLIGADPDGDALVYASAGPLPQGSFFDESNGRFEWIPSYDQAGSYALNFVARDASGAEDTVTVAVSVADVNRAPVWAFTNHQVALGDTLRFTVGASDADSSETLSFGAKGLPEGATFNTVTGAFEWTPTPGQTGDYLVNLSLTDGKTTVEQGLALRVNALPKGPAVSIALTPSFPAVPGQLVAINVLADAFSAVASRSLSVNGAPLALDANGRALFTAPASGLYQLVATTTDLDGYSSTTTQLLRVRNPLDSTAPLVALDAALIGSRITATQAIAGQIADSNLESWQLEITRADSESYALLAKGSTIIDDLLFQLDPARFDTDFYSLRLTATDVAGRVAQSEAFVELAATIKQGQYLRSETDFSFTLGGHTLDFTRRYDSLDAGNAGSFGQGWELVLRDVRVETDVPLTGSEDSGVYNPMRQGTRLYLTTPDGERVGFTFAPIHTHGSGYDFWTPNWVADADNAWQLRSFDSKLQRGVDRFFDLQTGNAYNSVALAGERAQYQLVALDGMVYEISS
jgi:hypothetical protein